MTDQLSLYNRALLHLGERSLTALTDNNEARRSLDQAWDSGIIRTEWLRCGLWNFATRTTERNYESALTPDFGYQYTYTKPSDWVKTAGVWSDEYQRVPLTEYRDEGGYWFSNIQVIYVSYVSNDASYGLDYSLWPENYARFCEYDLAMKIARRVTGADIDTLQAMERKRSDLLATARNTDAMDEPAKFPPQGSWVSSRTSRVNARNYTRGSW